MARHFSSAEEAAQYLEVTVDEAVQNINLQSLSKARRATNYLRNAALDVLAGQRSGKTYRLPNKQRTYQASAPGESPAVRTGDLKNRWRKQVLGQKNGNDLHIVARIRSDMPYSDMLEEGTSKMAPRPYKDKVRQMAMPKIKAIYGSGGFVI